MSLNSYYWKLLRSCNLLLYSMKKRLLCCCSFLFIGLVSSSWACHPYNVDSFFNPYVLISPHLELPVPQPVVQDQTSQIRAFFARFLFSETALNEMVGRALTQGIDSYDTDGLIRLLFQRFSLLGNELEQAVVRMNALGQGGVDPFSAFARALFEGLGLGPANSASRVAGLLTNATLFHDIEVAFWTSTFKEQGLTAEQALRAFYVMQTHLGQGFSYWRAFSWALFSEFHFNEGTILALNGYQEYLVQAGMPSYLAFCQALFSRLEGYGSEVYAMGIQRFNERIQAGQPLVAAYYATRFSFTGLTNNEVEEATERLMNTFENAQNTDYWGNAYMWVLYEAFGFPRFLASAMAEVNHNVFTVLGAQANPLSVFWNAAFRVLGVREDELENVYGHFVAYYGQGYQVREAFERAFLRFFVYEDELDAVTQAFFDTNIIDAGNNERLRFLLLKAWGARYPWIAEATLVDAIQGFFDSPSSLNGVLGVLSGFWES